MKIIKWLNNRIGGIILIMVIFFKNIENYIPKFYNYILILFIISDIYKIYRTKKYLKNKSTNELRIRNKNDSYFDILPFIIGIIFCTISVFGFLTSDSYKTLFILFFISGLVSIVQGVITIPNANAIIKYDNGNLSFENGTNKQHIKIAKIQTFEITENQITFLKDNQSKLIFQHLELNDAEIEKTKSFLKKCIK